MLLASRQLRAQFSWSKLCASRVRVHIAFRPHSAMSASTRVTRSAAAAAKAPRSAGSAPAEMPAPPQPQPESHEHEAPSAVPALQFVTLHTRNHKERESMYHFMQWNGNEEGLRQLQRILTRPGAYSDESCEGSTFELDLDTLRPEAVVDVIVEHAPDSNGYDRLYTKLTGVFHLPDAHEDEDADDYEMDIHDYLKHPADLFPKPGESVPELPEYRHRFRRRRY